MGAQIVTAARVTSRLLGVISLHHLGGPPTGPTPRRRSPATRPTSYRRGSSIGRTRARRAASVMRLRRRPSRSVVEDPSNSHNRLWPDWRRSRASSPASSRSISATAWMGGWLESTQEPQPRSRQQPPADRAGGGARRDARRRARRRAARDRARGAGATAVLPGFGLLGDLFERPFLAHWEIADGVARSEAFPGIAIRGRPFLGCVAVAPSAGLVERARAREAAVAARGASRSRRRRAAPYRRSSPTPRAACARSRRARTAATSTSRRRAWAAACCCRCTWRGRCCRSATRTSPRARGSAAAPRSRSRPRSRTRVAAAARRRRLDADVPGDRVRRAPARPPVRTS